MQNQLEKYLDHCLFFTANSLARTISRFAEEEFMLTGLSPSIAFIQMIVNQQPGISQNDIGTEMNLSPSTITRFIDRLEARELIRREVSGKNSFIHPTQKGLDIQISIEEAWSRLHERYATLLGREAADQLTSSILSANKMIEKETKKSD
jgi:DNA-binding MarR family transcriptional regulator